MCHAESSWIPGCAYAHAPNSPRKRNCARERLHWKLWKYGVLGPLEGHKLAAEIPGAGVQWEIATFQRHNLGTGWVTKAERHSAAVLDWPHRSTVWTYSEGSTEFMCLIFYSLWFTQYLYRHTDWLHKSHIVAELGRLFLTVGDTELPILSCISLGRHSLLE